MKNKMACLLFTLIYFSTAHATECSISSSEENKLFQMPFEQFYQTSLDRDLDKLNLHRNAIANGVEFDGNKVNLKIVDKLITYFNEPYSVAYRQ